MELKEDLEWIFKIRELKEDLEWILKLKLEWSDDQAKAREEGKASWFTEDFSQWLSYKWLKSNNVNYRAVVDAINQKVEGTWNFSDDMSIVDQKGNIIYHLNYIDSLFTPFAMKNEGVQVSTNEQRRLEIKGKDKADYGKPIGFTLTDVVSAEYVEKPRFSETYEPSEERFGYGVKLTTEKQGDFYLLSPPVWVGFP